LFHKAGLRAARRIDREKTLDVDPPPAARTSRSASQRSA